jgi:hypothetical protein
MSRNNVDYMAANRWGLKPSGKGEDPPTCAH